MHDLARLDPTSLLEAYSQGVFPMTDPDGRVRWYTANPRGVLPLDRFHVPQTLRSLVRQGRFDIRINAAFEETMRACMADRPEGSWISEALIEAYVRLHREGHAHSVEAWHNGMLVGGLYGVSLGGAFFGESMFHRRRDAGKVAMVHLVERLRERDYELLDAQAATPHLRRFGCMEISIDDYLKRLRRALRRDCTFE